ncbi:MAG: hypothetical protein ACXWC4_14250 [Telluria sp.]
MTDISIAPPLDGEQVSATAEQASFYVVSRRKLTILFIVTMGAYGVYWFYKNWRQYRDHGAAPQEVRDSIWPIPRAIFSVFFIHSLFSKVKALGHDKPQVAAWSDNLHAWWLVILYVAVSIADQLAKRSIGSPYTDFFGLVGLGLLLFAYRKAQVMVNASCGDPEGMSNNTLTGANYVWIIIGVLFWVGAFVSGFTDGASSGYSSSSSF